MYLATLIRLHSPFSPTPAPLAALWRRPMPLPRMCLLPPAVSILNPEPPNDPEDRHHQQQQQQHHQPELAPAAEAKRSPNCPVIGDVSLHPATRRPFSAISESQHRLSAGGEAEGPHGGPAAPLARRILMARSPALYAARLSPLRLPGTAPGQAPLYLPGSLPGLVSATQAAGEGATLILPTPSLLSRLST